MLKPALKVSKIIEAIESEVDLEFTKTASDDFFNTSVNDIYDDLYLWLSRTKGNIGLNVTGTSEVNMPIDSISFSNASPNEWSPTSQGGLANTSPYSRVQNGVWTCRPQPSFYGSTAHSYQTTFTIVTAQQATILIEEVGGTTIASVTGTGTLTTGQVSISTTNIFGQTRSIRFRVTIVKVV